MPNVPPWRNAAPSTWLWPVAARLAGYDGILVCPGFGSRGVEGKVKAVRFARGHVTIAGVLVGVTVAAGVPSYEGFAVMVAVFLATGVAFFSEFRSDREFEKLNATRDAIQVKVQRDGAVHTIALEDAVVGDLVLLEMGDEVPADGRVVRVYASRTMVRSMAEAALATVDQGRATCPLCEFPMDPDGHACPRWN